MCCELKKAGKENPRNSFLKKCGACGVEQIVFNRVVKSGKFRKRLIISPERKVWKNDTCPSCRWPKKQNLKTKPIRELLGPREAPKPTLNRCGHCNAQTVNRYNCSRCLGWHLRAAVREEDFFAQGVFHV